MTLDLLWALVPLSTAAGSALALVGLPPAYLAVVVGGWGILGGILWTRAPDALPGPGMGWANRVTLWRGALVMPVAALLPWWSNLGSVGLWWVVGVSTLAMTLDGVDGRIARRTGTGTSFGARFDMELDAFLLLALSFLAWLAGPMGPWVILIGALRYLFVAAGRIWPVLTGALPESFRRKTVCVIQGVGLLVALGPVVPPGPATGAAGLALAALVYSFAVDVAWLVRQGSPKGH